MTSTIPLKKPSSFDLRAFHKGIYTFSSWIAFRSWTHVAYARPYARNRAYTLVYHTYNVNAHYAWARTFTPAYGRE